MAVRADRRRQILDAALDAFLELGYDATTVDEIRDRSGASIGSLYHHFDGKAEIAGALYVEALAGYHASVRRILARNPGAKEGIESLVKRHLGWISDNQRQARFLFGMRRVEGVKAVEPEIAAMTAEISSALSAWARPHVRSGALRRMDPDVWFALCFGPAQELGRLYLSGRANTSPRKAATELAAGAWRALRAGGGS